MTVVTNRSSTQVNRMTEYSGPQGPGVMMNNFAGPSDTQNFAEPQYELYDDDQE